jgi:hypothetical protein
MCLDRLNGYLHNLRNILVFEALLVTEATAALHLLRQCLERSPKANQLLPHQKEVFRAGLVIRNGLRGRGPVVTLKYRVQRFLASVPLLCFTPPYLVEVNVGHNLPEPSFESRLSSKSAYSLEDTQKDILGEIL